MASAFAWFKENWFYAIAAVSLGLAGIFLVQYGIEKGFLPPTALVLATLAFGGVLITCGEFVRRKGGVDEDSPAALLPSTFSSAGVVVLYASVIPARSLYGLIDSGSALDLAGGTVRCSPPGGSRAGHRRQTAMALGVGPGPGAGPGLGLCGGGVRRLSRWLLSRLYPADDLAHRGECDSAAFGDLARPPGARHGELAPVAEASRPERVGKFAPV